MQRSACDPSTLARVSAVDNVNSADRFFHRYAGTSSTTRITSLIAQARDAAIVGCVLTSRLAKAGYAAVLGYVLGSDRVQAGFKGLSESRHGAAGFF